MFLSAYVQDKQTKQHTVIQRDTYTSKRKFIDDLRGNGYKVIRVSNNRDLAAQDCGYESFLEMKKNMDLYNKDRELWKNEIEKIEEIGNIEL